MSEHETANTLPPHHTHLGSRTTDLWWCGLHKEMLARRVVRWLLQFYVQIGFGRGSNPTLALMASQGGDRKAIVLTKGVITLAMIGAGLGALQLKNSRPCPALD